MSDNIYECRECGVKVLVPQPPRAGQGKQCPIHGLCSHCAGTACPAPGCGRPKLSENATCGRDMCAVWERGGGRRVLTYEERIQHHEGRIN